MTDISHAKLLRMDRMLVKLLGFTKAAFWWDIPNPQFGNVTPRQMFEAGLANKLYAFVKTAYDESKGSTTDRAPEVTP